MTIILFLVDTSASMNQRAYVDGVPKTYLDIAKASVDIFIKCRQRSRDCVGDHYMLLTSDEQPKNMKATWKESHETFLKEVSKLQATGLTSLAVALNNAFQMLNIHRLQSRIDTYGMGRCPFLLQPTVIIVVTDGGKFIFRNKVHKELVLRTRNATSGPSLTKEPFRWDQRLFSLVLRIPGQPVHEPMDEIISRDESQIEKLCNDTGGRSYKITSQYVLNQCIESIVKKMKPGVVIHLEQCVTNLSERSTIPYHNLKTMMYVPKQMYESQDPDGHWPIPESHWPSTTTLYLPPRDAHPRILVAAACCDEPQLIPNFPIDKYELEHNPFTLQILGKRDPSKVWPVSVLIEIEGKGTPFGYLKANSSLTAVHLFVLPYGHQILFPLLDDLLNNFKFMPNDEWMRKFDFYVNSIPQYYCAYLQSALFAINVPHDLIRRLFPLSTVNYMSRAVIDKFQHTVRVASLQHVRNCSLVAKQLKQQSHDSHHEQVPLTAGVLQQNDFVSHPMLREAFSKLDAQVVNYDKKTVVVPVTSQLTSYQNKDYRRPFHVSRRTLLEEEARMRSMFYHTPTSGNVAQISSPVASIDRQQIYLKNLPLKKRVLARTGTHRIKEIKADFKQVGCVNVDNVREETIPKVPTTQESGSTPNDYNYDRFRATAPASSSNGDDKMMNIALDYSKKTLSKRDSDSIAMETQRKSVNNAHSIANILKTPFVPKNPMILDPSQFTRNAITSPATMELEENRTRYTGGCINDAAVEGPKRLCNTLVENSSDWIEETNARTRYLLFKDIRHSGRDYANLLKHLELLRGNETVRRKYVDMCVKQALHLRRHDLIDCIREWWNKCVENCAKM